ncbi:MAG: hypothetical protein M1839_003658 [Geoglossum umbratile]|nr:MAG: hypothetical protein M1839_003658 [Geoglossum umbratile]
MSSSSAASPPQLKVRKRADTRILLGDDYHDIVKDVPPPPHPPRNALDYEQENIKERLIYADCALRNPERKLSPIGIRALKLYKDACARLLDLEEGEVFEGGEEELQEAKDEWKATIRMYDGYIQYTACLQITRTSDAQTLQEQLLALQRTAFYSRYGDMFAEACRRLKREAEIKKVDGWGTLQMSYWTDIGKTLLEEKEAYGRVLKGEMAHGQCPLHLAISQTCDRIGFNADDMRQIIHHYAVRNEIVHSNLIPLIRKGLFHDLGKQLNDDFCNIPLIIPDVEKTQTALMMRLLETIINEWFNRDQDEPDNYQLWTPTEKLITYYKSLRGPNPRDEVSLQKEMTSAIEKGVRKRLREAEKEKEIVETMSEEFGLISGQKKTKRVSSSQLQLESDRAKRMKVEWDKLMNLAHRVRKISDTYLENFGELGAPPEIVVDPSLDD